MAGSKTERTVLSTRPSVPDDEAAALANNIRLVTASAWEYRWLTPSRKILDEVLLSLPDAWVFTSRRGVEGWRRVLDIIADELQVSGPPKIPAVYAVGDRTAEAVQHLFDVTDVRTTGMQDGAALARRMMEDGVKKAIHFCGAQRRTELRDALRSGQLDFHEVEVYRRTDVQQPDPEIEKLCQSGQVDAIFFFSPDGVSGFFRLYGLPRGDWIPVAVGPTTAVAVRDETGREPRIARSPSFREMIRLV